MFNFGNKMSVGVCLTPERGLEVIQIDYVTKQVVKYGRKQLEYNVVRRDIADFDLLKEYLGELLETLEIPKGTELSISIPTVLFSVVDYPASLDSFQVESAIEESLYEKPFFKDYEPCFSYALVNSTLQFNKYVCTAAQRASVTELIMIVKDLGYKVKTINTSVDSVLNSLVYIDRVNTEPGTNWVLLIVDNYCCRVLSMIGKNYMDAYEENISIGDVLSDAENYATVISAVEPILRNLPSKYLCVVSKTDVISAEILANKLSYSAPIIYQEANSFRKEELIELAPTVDEEDAKNLTLDSIGAGIYADYTRNAYIKLNLFNHLMGDLYAMEQPPAIMNGKVVLTEERLIMFFIVFAVAVAAIIIALFAFYTAEKVQMNNKIESIKQQISTIDEYLNQHKDISTETFDEGDEIRIGLTHNKGIYSYYTIMGTEIPEKLWLTHIKFGNNVTIEGQADNLESVYGFFRNIKDYNPNSDIKLQKLGLAISDSHRSDNFDAESVLTTLDADFYEFRISNEPPAANTNTNTNTNTNSDKEKNNSKAPQELELID